MFQPEDIDWLMDGVDVHREVLVGHYRLNGEGVFMYLAVDRLAQANRL